MHPMRDDENRYIHCEWNMTFDIKWLSLLLLSILSFESIAGFCDNRGNLQEIQNIQIFNGKAYIGISPGLSGGGEAELCARNEVALPLSDVNLKTIYPLLMSAMIAGKKTVLSYCGSCSTHGYKGPSVQVAEITSVNVGK